MEAYRQRCLQASCTCNAHASQCVTVLHKAWHRYATGAPNLRPHDKVAKGIIAVHARGGHAVNGGLLISAFSTATRRWLPVARSLGLARSRSRSRSRIHSQSRECGWSGSERKKKGGGCRYRVLCITRHPQSRYCTRETRRGHRGG